MFDRAFDKEYFDAQRGNMEIEKICKWQDVRISI